MALEHVELMNKIFSFTRSAGQSVVEMTSLAENTVNKFCREHKVMYSNMETLTDNIGSITGYTFFLRYKQ